MFYGKATDAAAEGAETVKRAIEGRDFLNKFVEDNSHTAVLIGMASAFFIR
jgi:hypothetical protein